FLGDMLFPDQLLVANLYLVAGLGLDLGLVLELFLVQGLCPALVLSQWNGGQHQPALNETFIVDARGIVGQGRNDNKRQQGESHEQQRSAHWSTSSIRDVGKKTARAANEGCRLPRIGFHCHGKPFAFCLSRLVRNLSETSTIEKNAFLR